MTRNLEVVLLLALPASGKSEIRRYLESLTPERRREDMHLGSLVQLDDYPYVRLMRHISRTLRRDGHGGVFFDAEDRSMRDPRDWGALIELLNEDFHDLTEHRRIIVPSAAAWMFERLDAAREAVGAEPALARLPSTLRGRLIAALEPDCRELLAERNDAAADRRPDRTVVIEFARGGPDGATPPLSPPIGYASSFSRLDDAILERAAILYVWVTPEESRRRNFERGLPDTDSVLHHCVPLPVMLGDYGCDDIAWLIAQSDRADTVRFTARKRVRHVPIARFDNRVDHTSFVRADRALWKPEQVLDLHAALSEAFGRLVLARDQRATSSGAEPEFEVGRT